MGCLCCGPLIKAIDAYLAKADNDLEDELEAEGYALPGETVEAINGLEDAVAVILTANATEVLDQLEKLDGVIDLEEFFRDRWPKIKDASNLAQELFDAFYEEFDTFMPRLVEAYVHQTDAELTVGSMTQRTTAWVKSWSEELSQLMKLDTEAQIEAVLVKGLEDGSSIGDVARAIADSGIRSPGYKARRTALTEVLRAHSYGSNEAMVQSPAVTEKMWQHTGAGVTPRPNHVAMSGTRVPKNEPFTLTGADGSTYYPMMPRDTSLPASESINCHCNVQPVVSEDVLGLPLEERQRLQAEAIAEDDGAWKAELDAKNKAKAGIEEN